MYISILTYYSLVVFFVMIVAILPVGSRLNSLQAFSLFITLVLIVVFRSSEMPDYSNYVNYYFSNIESESILYREPSKYIIKIISPNLFVFMFIYAAISVGLKILYIYKYHDSNLLFYFSYIVLFFVLHEMIQIRVSLAVGILLFCFPAAKERNFFKFLMIILIASLFHITSLFFIIVYFYRKNIHWKFLFLCIILSYVFVDIMNDIVMFVMSISDSKLISFYVSRYREVSEFKIINILTLPSLVLFLIFYVNKNRIPENGLYPFYIQNLAVGTIAFPAFNIFSGAVSYRILELYSSTNIALLPLLCLFFTKVKSLGKAIFIIWCLFYVFCSMNLLWLNMEFSI